MHPFFNRVSRNINHPVIIDKCNKRKLKFIDEPGICEFLDCSDDDSEQFWDDELDNFYESNSGEEEGIDEEEEGIDEEDEDIDEEEENEKLHKIISDKFQEVSDMDIVREIK